LKSVATFDYDILRTIIESEWIIDFIWRIKFNWVIKFASILTSKLLTLAFI